MRYIAQGIGFIGMALVFIAFQNNNKRKILLIQACACIMFTIHFILLGAYTGAIMNAAEVARDLLFRKDEKLKHKTGWIAVFMALFTAMGIFTWQNTLSIFPIIAMNLSNFAYSLKNPRSIRLCYLPVSALWLTYNISVVSVAGIITETVCLISMLIAFWRYDIKRNKNTEQA